MNSPSITKSARSRERRRRKWVGGDMQLKIVLMTLSVATIVLAVGFQLNLMGLSSICSHPPPTIQETLDQIKASLLKEFLMAFCVVIPLSIWVGVVYSFRFCGPVYRVRRFFQDLAEGRWDQRCMFREGDDLQDVREAINVSLGLMAEKFGRLQEILRETHALLDDSSIGTPDRGRIERLRDRIEQESADLSRRLGQPSASPPIPEDKLERAPERVAECTEAGRP